MRARLASTTPYANESQKSGSIDEACARYGYGRATMRRIAEDAQAVIRVGRTVRYNYDKISQYLDQISGT